MEENGSMERDDIYSQVVRAGKRTYFFDVRSTRGNDYFLTITESKKIFGEDGNVSYQKHKIFLYKEDFEKFSEALGDAFRKVLELNRNKDEELESKLDSKFTDISFDDLDKSGEEQ